VLVDQLGELQGRHRLGVGGGDEERVGIDRIEFAERLHAQAALVDDLAAVDQAEADARDVELLHDVLREVLEQGDAFGVERMGFAAGKLLALYPLGRRLPIVSEKAALRFSKVARLAST